MPSVPFFPKADAIVLSCAQSTPPPRPRKVWPIFDKENFDKPIAEWPCSAADSLYPSPKDRFAVATAPEQRVPLPDRYLRAFLASNERLRLGMLWYYTRGIFEEKEFLDGLQQKAEMAQESMGWEFVVIGLLDLNYYIRLSTIGLPLAILPRGETICAHTVTQTPGSVFLLPSLMEDWRFQECPYVESGGLRAYAGAPLRLQNDSGDCVGLGSICVASSTSQPPLTKTQQQQLVRLGDWVVSDIIQCARARRQQERRQMVDSLANAQNEAKNATSDEPVLRILKDVYKDADIYLQSLQDDHLKIGDEIDIPLSQITNGFWENAGLIDHFIAHSNQRDLPTDKIVRIIAVPCRTISGKSLLVVASRDFRFVFDDVDSWFIEACGSLLANIWQERLLKEAVQAKEKFLRGFSHQLRTPIHGILGSVELLAEELMTQYVQGYPTTMPLSETAGEKNRSDHPSVYLETIRLAGRDLVSIINNMINLNRWTDIAVSDREYASHDLNELEKVLANEVQRFTKDDSRFQSSIFFNHDPSASSVRFLADLNVLGHSILPLIINAAQCTEGVVLVTAAFNADRKQLVIDVRDTGIGIPSDDHQRIFQPYEKVDENSPGAGLGLTLASKFAALHRGIVKLVSSEKGRGSHFQLCFRDIESKSLASASQPCAKRFPNLPAKFHQLGGGLEHELTCDVFSRMFGSYGLIQSAEITNSIVICSSTSDQIPTLPANQVALCLVSQNEQNTVSQLPNIFQIRQPYTTATIQSVLEKADKYLSQQRTSYECDPASKKVDCTITSPGHPFADLTSTPLHLVRPVTTGTEPLPISQDGSDTAAAVAVAPVTPASVDSVLIVDDNMVNLRILQMYCKRRGIQYFSANEGQEAVRIFQEQQVLMNNGKGAGIQLILMDLQMPICNGFDATKQIRWLEEQQGWRKSTLFIVTAQDSSADRDIAKSIGADDYFTKPVSLKKLDESIRHYFPGF